MKIIAEKIPNIDDIACQTNLLALDAARASKQRSPPGDVAGRGGAPGNVALTPNPCIFRPIVTTDSVSS